MVDRHHTGTAAEADRHPARHAALMSLRTVIVAINAKLLERARKLVASTSEELVPKTKTIEEKIS